MSTYIGKLSVDNGAAIPVGSTLYGTCSTPAATGAKVVTLANFDELIHGVTIHVKFTNGNTATLDNSFTLQVGSTDARTITNPGGSVSWAADAVISFTYDDIAQTWIANDGTTTSIAISNTYDATSTNGISGQGVAAALNTLGDAAEKDVVTSIVESGTGANKNSTNLPTTNAITAYVDSKTSGLTQAMHFRGVTTTTMSDGLTTATVVIGGNNFTPAPGDVVLSGTHQEYVWVETNATSHAGYWELLGDEGSYLLASQVQNKAVIDGITFDQGTLPTVTLDANATNVLTGISNSTGNNAARAASAVVEQGVLKLTTGILQQFNTGSVHGVASTTAGSLPTLTPSTANVLQATT